MLVSCMYKMQLYQKIKQNVLAEEKNNRIFCCLSVRDFEHKYWSIVYIFTNFEKKTVR